MGNVKIERASVKRRVIKVAADLLFKEQGLRFEKYDGSLWVDIDPQLCTSSDPGRIITEDALREWCTSVLEALDE